MQVAGVKREYNPKFENGFYNTTRELDSSVMLSRAVVDMFGCCIPWIIFANNNTERKEKARKFSFEYTMAWLSPFLTLPFANRLGMRYVGKLTKNLWSNNHKAIHISNEFLKDSSSMMQELERMSKKTTRGPFETLFNKLNPNKKYEQKINIQELLDSCNGDKEKLRKKLIKAKNAVFTADFFCTTVAMGSFPFLNNEITKKKSGQQGFSAEMNMADKDIVEKRAGTYEKTKKKRFLSFVGITGCAALLASLAGFAPLLSKKPNKFINTLKNNSKLFDYNKGMYMSRLPLAIVVLLSSFGFILSARNKTEQKDLLIRNTVGYGIFFGGDLLLGSLFTNLSDRIFGTKLRKDDGQNKSLLRKIFPKVKPLKQVIEEVEQGKISKSNKKVSAGIFWANMLILMGSMGYLIPKAINKMIKSDVEKDVQANKIQNNPQSGGATNDTQNQTNKNVGLVNPTYSPYTVQNPSVGTATPTYNKPLKMEEFLK